MPNFTEWMNNFMEYSMQGYENALGFLMYPVLFSAIIAYVYLKTQSVVAFAVAVMLIFVAFGSNAFLGVPEFYSFMHIVVALIFTGLVLIFISKRRN